MNDKRDGDDTRRPRGPAGDRPKGARTARPGGGAGKPFRAKPGAGAAGEGGEARRFDKPKKSFGGKDGKPFKPRDGDRSRPGARDGEGAREGRSFEKRDGRPFAKREGGSFAKREGGSSEGRESRPFVKREGANSEKREGRSFEKREGGSFAKREGGFTKREGGFDKREGRSFDKKEGRSFEKREASVSDRPRSPRPRREEGAEETGGAMRIAKRLARAGIASRRDAEGMIADGRVRLNGHLVETPAIVVKATDRIEIDGEPLPAIERTRLWLFHKPAGLVTTNRDPEGRPTVFDRLPEDLPRVMSVGRLDINTEGLLLLTNDGGLARTLELPETGWLRRYRVRAHGTISQKQLDELKHGIAVDGVFYGAIEATLDSEKGSNVWMTLGLREGKNREVKRVLGHLGLDVNRLIRISFGPFQLGELPEGAVREIRGRTLRDQLGERLIEDSGADFDAPINNPFSNEVVESAPKRRTDEDAAEKREKPVAKSEWVTARGDAKPSRKKFGEAKRESALSRLDTKPRREGFAPRDRDGDGDGERSPRPERSGGDKPFRAKRPERGSEGGESDERAARPKAPTGRRSANVWIAPGGRPLGEKKAAERAARDAARPERESGDKPLRSRGFRDAPEGASRADGDKPRRSAGFRQQSTGKSFGGGDKSGDRPRRPSGGGAGGAGGKRPPRGE